MRVNELLAKFLFWRIKHLSDRDFVLILSVVVGLLGGLAAVILKELVHLIQNFLTRSLELQITQFLYLAYPLIGILLTVVVASLVFKEKTGHGITDILYHISKGSSIIQRTKMYSKMILSSLTVGLGGSVGLEAPIVVTGSAIGSNVAQLMHLNYKKRTLLIGCGSAAAISGIFNSPIAGVIFCIEVILIETSVSSFIPLLISSVAGSIISLMLLGDDVLFTFKITEPFNTVDVPFFAFLGIVAGLVSLYFTRMMYRVEGIMHNIKGNIKRALVGGLSLGAIIFLLPPIYGEGYHTITSLLTGREFEVMEDTFFANDSDSILFILFILGVILFKPIATAATLGSGGSGGIFAPSLFMGGLTGFLFAEVINVASGETIINTSNFTLVGMCGVMSAVMRAPLTAIFLIAEITGGYTLFVPLMLVSAIAYSTISYFEKHSFYTKSLIEKGHLITDDKDRQVLSLIDIKKVIEKDLLTIHPDATIEELVELVKNSKRNIFPVVDQQRKLLGIITLDDIREIMFDEDLRKKVKVSSVMHDPPNHISSKENMQSVMNKFEVTGAWNLPVIDDNKYVGIVSKSRIFNAYRYKLIRQNKD